MKCKLQRRWLVLIFLAAVGIAIAVSVSIYGPGGKVIPETENAVGDVTPSVESTESMNAVGDGLSANSAQTQISPPPQSPIDEPAVVEAKVRILTPDGKPVSDARLEWRSPFGPADAADGVTVRSDERGTISIKLRAPSWVSLTSRDDRWALRQKFDVPAGSNDFQFTAWPLGAIEILVLCEDGTPFAEGRCLVRSGRIDADSLFGFRQDPQGLNVSLVFSAAGEASLRRVPLHQDLRFSFLPSVIGYSEQQHFVERGQLFDGSRILLTLESNPDETGGILEFDWTGYEADRVRIRITPRGNQVQVGGGLDSDGPPFCSGLLKPGEYVVHIEGNPGWESQPFRINARSVTYVQYESSPGTSVRVQILDETGDPIPGAIFTRDYEAYPNLDAPFRAGRRSAVSDQEGRATLQDVPLGPQSFLIEAHGFEPVTLSRDLSSGDVIDLGSTILLRCRGKLVIRLVGMAEKQPYTVLLLQPGGAAVRVVKDVRVDEVTLEPLPARTYVVAVVAGTGGVPAAQTVVITEAAPTHDVVLDVSGLVAGSMQPE